jgi:predicted transglutaminase-like cysteine proteinase
LMTRGWPARALLLSEVVTGGGEHHLVLVVRTRDADLVLDNMTGKIVPWFETPYRWVRIQMPGASRRLKAMDDDRQPIRISPQAGYFAWLPKV